MPMRLTDLTILPHSQTPGDSYTAQSYLQAFTDAGTWQGVCLAHMFTRRTFEGGIIGLAWVGSSSAPGGICDRSNYNTVALYIECGPHYYYTLGVDDWAEFWQCHP